MNLTLSPERRFHCRHRKKNRVTVGERTRKIRWRFAWREVRGRLAVTDEHYGGSTKDMHPELECF